MNKEEAEGYNKNSPPKTKMMQEIPLNFGKENRSSDLSEFNLQGPFDNQKQKIVVPMQGEREVS
jgi:hypothetical protein